MKRRLCVDKWSVMEGWCTGTSQRGEMALYSEMWVTTHPEVQGRQPPGPLWEVTPAKQGLGNHGNRWPARLRRLFVGHRWKLKLHFLSEKKKKSIFMPRTGHCSQSNRTFQGIRFQFIWTREMLYVFKFLYFIWGTFIKTVTLLISCLECIVLIRVWFSWAKNLF